MKSYLKKQKTIIDLFAAYVYCPSQTLFNFELSSLTCLFKSLFCVCKFPIAQSLDGVLFLIIYQIFANKRMINLVLNQERFKLMKKNIPIISNISTHVFLDFASLDPSICAPS